MSALWGKSVNAAIANTEVKRVVKNPAHRNAYRLKLLNAEYNAGKSPRHPNAKARVKMYAELTGTENRKNHGIKSLWGNTLKVYWMGALGSSNNRMHGKFTALTA